ncbi:hypothetical protein BV25DRAFT_1919249 [Artomyces pyxidatus]|uniref:Uncharacterized protein n=1 Tax=Artomyces pyxidatus TaxID=48021 RepID=A0ACB8SRS6_9AGAM|nr:hypothetical protein BV25DRAFT_1919249 [Artomyces pyxidatus]
MATSIGSYTAHQLAGYRATLVAGDPLERYSRRADYEKRRRNVIETRRPISQLTDKLDPKKTLYPPELHFGLALTQDELLAYANKHGLVEEDYPDDPLDVFSCRYPVMMCLRELTDDSTVYIAPPFVPGTVRPIMVALYSNYTRSKQKLVDEDEREVLDIIRDELNLEGQPALWYWDAGNPW